MKTAELTGAALDWAVAKCEGVNDEAFRLYYEPTEPTDYDTHGYPEFHYSTIWAQGGPIIEREKLGAWWATHYVDADGQEYGNHWYAETGCTDDESLTQCVADGPTPLIAAMRCYVASKLGDDIEIPEELKGY